jgi:hypothetical protein
MVGYLLLCSLFASSPFHEPFKSIHFLSIFWRPSHRNE